MLDKTQFRNQNNPLVIENGKSRFHISINMHRPMDVNLFADVTKFNDLFAWGNSGSFN
jgi:hypothetical protein